ncbi:hypothetical protein M8J76_011629 [Diaphorina citri]|nr:hypothetical protein M8J76_011629 [Diaphorina citri]
MLNFGHRENQVQGVKDFPSIADCMRKLGRKFQVEEKEVEEEEEKKKEVEEEEEEKERKEVVERETEERDIGRQCL